MKETIQKEKKKEIQFLGKPKESLKISERNESYIAFKVFKYAGILLIFFIVFTCGSRKRIGAKCRDGTSSYSIGSGTCSHHNGVKSWKYEYWWD